MARAKTIPAKPVQAKIRLTLTTREALVLHAICGNVTIKPGTAYEQTHAVYNALGEVLSGRLYFDDLFDSDLVPK